MRLRLPSLCLGLVIVYWSALGLGRADLSPLGEPPDWSRLDPYQETITREAFVRLLRDVYAIDNAHRLTMRVRNDHVKIKTGKPAPDDWYELRFASEANLKEVTIERYWRPSGPLPATNQAKPLTGVRIALDPGHLGGRWARMEERFYQLDTGEPVKEGEMTLRVAKLLKPRLEALGATVLMVRDSHEPTTLRRPEHFLNEARQDLARIGITNPPATYAPDAKPDEKWKTLQWHQEKYFYRSSEIRERAEKVNRELKPDVALCLHFNAEAWGDPSEPTFVPRNHFHILINGAYSIGEFGHDDERLQVLLRLLQHTHSEEVALAEVISREFAAHTQLPAYTYTTNNVKRVSSNPYLYARNLMANRLFECPVIYFEPYVMNCQEVFDRVQAGAYKGKREIHGRLVSNLYEEYAQAVIKGLVAFYEMPFLKRHRQP